jgi:SAM-dependent methyltransferase
MSLKAQIAIWKQEEEKPFSGWDFSYLDGRWKVEQPPWDYFSRAAELMQQSSSAIDMGTGGGEELLRLKKYWPQKITATESYLPNLKLAIERLRPFGVKVVDVPINEDNLMPFTDNKFELVLNRHSGFNPSEVARILAPGGIFLTQQVHGLSFYELMSCFQAKSQYPEATLENYLPKLKTAGLKIVNTQEWSGKISFTDVGAMVYYLKAIPWVVPGFSVETHSKYLLSLQECLENGEALTFTTRQYLIEARK